jgi:hypothetical protein
MNAEIDQSGKIEQTNLDTIIALSNNIQYSIVLSKKSKRTLQSLFRDKARPRMFIYQTFSALIAILLINAKPKTKILIDTEYQGHDDIIRSLISKYVRSLSKKRSCPFEFGYVGKTSPAHILAAQVAYKKKKSNKTITLKEISTVLWPKKSDRASA